MRFWILALMIAVLPLRAWAGDVMAVNMASQAVLKAQAGPLSLQANPRGDTHLIAGPAMPEDCPMNLLPASNPVAASDDSAADTTTVCNCNTCELCMTLATAARVDRSPVRFTHSSEPDNKKTAFTNADRASFLKPPIS